MSKKEEEGREGKKWKGKESEMERHQRGEGKKEMGKKERSLGRKERSERRRGQVKTCE